MLNANANRCLNETFNVLYLPAVLQLPWERSIYSFVGFMQQCALTFGIYIDTGHAHTPAHTWTHWLWTNYDLKVACFNSDGTDLCTHADETTDIRLIYSFWQCIVTIFHRQGALSCPGGLQARTPSFVYAAGVILCRRNPAPQPSSPAHCNRS